MSKKYDKLIKLYEKKINLGKASLYEYYELGRFYSLKRQGDKAKSQYELLLKKFPGEQKALQKLAEIYTFTGDVNRSVELYTQLSEGSPDNPEYSWSLINTLIKFGKNEEAIKPLELCVDRFPSDSRFSGKLSEIYIELGKKDDALKLWKKMYAHNQNDTYLLKNLGQIYFETGNFTEAQKFLVLYNDRTGGDSLTHQLLGDVYSREGYRENSLNEYRKALDFLVNKKTSADNTDDIARMVYLNLILGRKTEALSLLEMLSKKVSIQPEMLLTMGNLYNEMDQYSKAVQVLHEYNDRTGGDADSYQFLGSILEKTGDRTAAVKEYERALSVLKMGKMTKAGEKQLLQEVNLNLLLGKQQEALTVLERLYSNYSLDPEMLLIMGNIYNKLKQYENAVMVLKKYNKQTGGDLESYQLLGEVLSSIGDQEGRNRALEKALHMLEKQDVERSDKRMLELRAELYLLLGMKSKALDTLEMIYKRFPLDPDRMVTMGEMYYEQKNYKKATEILRSYHEKTDGDHHSHHLYGDVLAALGDREGSRREYKKALDILQ